MSDLSYSAIADLVRQRLGLPVDTRLRIQSLVRTALQRLGQQVAQDKWNRQYLITDPDTLTVALSGGKADLTTIISVNQVLEEWLPYGFFWHDNKPLQWKRGRDIGNLQAPFDNVFKHCWLEGRTLYTKGTNNQGLTGSLGCALVASPTLLNLNPNLEDTLLDLATGLAQAQPLDYMETPGNPA